MVVLSVRIKAIVFGTYAVAALPVALVRAKRLRVLTQWLDQQPVGAMDLDTWMMDLVHAGWVQGVQEMCAHCSQVTRERAVAVAADQGKADLLRVLLDNNPQDRTPVLWATVQGGHVKAAQVVLQHEWPTRPAAAPQVIRRLLDTPELTAAERAHGLAVLDQAAAGEAIARLVGWEEIAPGQFPLARRRLARHQALVKRQPSPDTTVNTHHLFDAAIKAQDVVALQRRLPHATASQHRTLPSALIDADWGEGLLALAPWINLKEDFTGSADLLIIAARRGKNNAVQALLTVCDPRASNSLALWEAVNNGHEAVFEALLPHADPKAEHSSALFVAAERGFESLVRRLLPVSDLDPTTSLPLRAAAQQGHLKVAQLLLPYSDPKAADSEALYQAVDNDHEALVAWLLPLSDPRARRSRAMILALEKGLLDIVTLLMPVSTPADVVKQCQKWEQTSPSKAKEMWGLLDVAAMTLEKEPIKAWAQAIPPDQDLPRFRARWRACQAQETAPTQVRRRLRS